MVHPNRTTDAEDYSIDDDVFIDDESAEPNRGLSSLRKNMLQLGIVLIAVFGALVIFHGIRTENASGAFAMAVEDIKVSARCPTQLSTIGTFVTRTKAHAELLRSYKKIESEFTLDPTYVAMDWTGLVCSIGWPEALSPD